MLVLTDDSCTCSDYRSRREAKDEKCKHMKAVERQQKRVSGPHYVYAPSDRPEEFDRYSYWRCENCGAEATRKGALEDCC